LPKGTSRRDEGGGAVASKIAKLRAALPRATGEVLCFVDDDVGLRPAALRTLIRYLFLPRAGAVFGLACYTEWRTLWSSLMSAFVNANALLSYIPLTYLAEPFTITGHCFALRRLDFDAAGGFEGMEHNVGDDHELARRLRRLGLRTVQTPMIYDVANHFDSLHSYVAQLKRWFVFPRQVLLPFMTPREQMVSFLGSTCNLSPSVLALLALLSRRWATLRALGASLGLFGAVYALCEARYLKRRTPARRWPLLLVVALLTPLQIVAALLSSDEVEWRGRRLRIRRGGGFEVVGDE
jgi:ceramide glucosyltransferase